MIALPPAGGCVTSRIIMKKIPRPTEIAITKKEGISKYVLVVIPTREVIKWPKNMFFGWEKGLLGNPKIKTIVAPNDPNNKL